MAKEKDMKNHESMENYLETILVLTQKMGNVKSIDVAHELGFSKPSVSVAVKNMKTKGYIVVEETGYIKLTDEGRLIAESIYERHQVISKHLELLGVRKETAAEDACKLEHVLSEESFEAMKLYVEKHME